MKFTRFYKYPPLLTFEDFKKDIAESDPLRLEYFYHQILWGEKVRYRKIERNRKIREKLKKATQSSPTIAIEPLPFLG